jgi:hypothetical protein
VRALCLSTLLAALTIGCTDAEKEAWVASRCVSVEDDVAVHKSCIADAALDYDNGIR